MAKKLLNMDAAIKKVKEIIGEEKFVSIKKIVTDAEFQKLPPKKAVSKIEKMLTVEELIELGEVFLILQKSVKDKIPEGILKEITAEVVMMEDEVKTKEPEETKEETKKEGEKEEVKSDTIEIVFNKEDFKNKKSSKFFFNRKASSVHEDLKKEIYSLFKKDKLKKQIWKDKWNEIKLLIEVNNFDVDYDKMYLIAFYYDKKKAMAKLSTNDFFNYWHDDDIDFFKKTFKEINQFKIDGNVYTKIILLSELIRNQED